MDKQHLWQGEWLNDEGLESRIVGLPQVIANALRRGLDTAALLTALTTLAGRLMPGCGIPEAEGCSAGGRPAGEGGRIRRCFHSKLYLQAES